MNTFARVLVTHAVFLLAAALPAAAFAGYRIVDDEGRTTLVSNGRIKSVPKGPGEPIHMLDVNRGRILMAAPQTRLYWEGTVEEFCKEFPAALEKALAGMQAEMERQRQAEMARLSPAERAKRQKEEAELKKRTEELNTPEGQAKMKREMEEWAKKMGVDPKGLEEADKPTGPERAPTVKVERTGETATVAGLQARKFRVTVDGEPYEDHWIATDPAFLRELSWERFAQFQERFHTCMEQGEKPGAEGGSVEESKEYRQLERQGFALKVVSYEGGNPDGEPKEQVQAIERRDVPDGEFGPPAGFKKATLAEMSAVTLPGPGGGQQK
jgi:Domain of unknown function (DUF4412)